MLVMIFKMSLVTFLYVALTAALKLWVHTDKSVLTKRKRIFIGVLYGISAILSTHFGVRYDEMTLNVRDIAPLAAGLFFDPVSGIIAGLIGGIERYIVGTYFGIGSYTRIACSISTCLAGFLAALFNVKFFHGKKPSPFYALCLGAVTEVFHMYVVLITHRNDMEMAFYVVDTCAHPMIAFTGLGMFLSSIVLYALSGRLKGAFKRYKDEDVTISIKFQFYLFICTVVMLFATYKFSDAIQTRYAIQSAQKTMTSQTEDAKATYNYMQADYNSVIQLVKKQTLTMAHAAAAFVEYQGGVDSTSDKALEILKNTYKFYEINIINKDGIIIRSTTPENINFDMKSTAQSSPFIALIDGTRSELAQDLRPIGRDKNIQLMYVGVKCGDGALQVALDADMIDTYGTMDEYANMFGTRHIGEKGAIYVADNNGTIMTGEQKGKTFFDIGVENIPEETGIYYFNANILNVKSYCRMEIMKNGTIFLAIIPIDEVFLISNTAAYETGFADVLLFAVIFLLIYILVQKIVVNNLDRINNSLHKITRGRLDEVVNVRSTSEFASLSDDINLTVDALKGYIDQAEKRIEQELEFARQIQSSALPKVFKFPRTEFDLFALMDPAKEVGGDFYDFFFIDQHKFALVVADVSGKGIPASLFMMRSKTAIKSLAESGRSPSAIFEKANNVLCEGNDADMFVTAWIGIVNLETGEVQCANAGHEYPAIKRADGTWELVKDKHGLALAAMEDMPFKDYTLQLYPGDKLFVYTDGVPEAINEKEEQFGTDGMLSALNASKASGMCNILPFVRKRIAAFVGEADQFDDITMLGFEFNSKNANTDQ